MVRTPEGMRPLGGPRRRSVYTFEKDLINIGLSGMDWIDISQDRDQWKALMNMVINYPSGSINIGYFLSSLQQSTSQEELSSKQLVDL
jgi:hypothetical protein